MISPGSDCCQKIVEFSEIPCYHQTSEKENFAQKGDAP